MRNRWTKESILTEARKYTTRQAFNKGSASAYSIAANSGWLEEACRHMCWNIRYWTVEELFCEARKYKTKGELRTHNLAAYQALHKRGLIGSACAHMPSHAQRHPDAEYILYTYTYAGFAYVGITTSSAFRSENHKTSTQTGIKWLTTKSEMCVFGSDPNVDNHRTGAVMRREVAERFERIAILRMVRRGWKLFNKTHNPQYDHGKREYSFSVPWCHEN